MKLKWCFSKVLLYIFGSSGSEVGKQLTHFKLNFEYSYQNAVVAGSDRPRMELKYNNESYRALEHK